jgi:hypothetical protein
VTSSKRFIQLQYAMMPSGDPLEPGGPCSPVNDANAPRPLSSLGDAEMLDVSNVAIECVRRWLERPPRVPLPIWNTVRRTASAKEPPTLSRYVWALLRPPLMAQTPSAELLEYTWCACPNGPSSNTGTTSPRSCKAEASCEPMQNSYMSLTHTME